MNRPIIAVVFALSLSTQAFADDAADCAAGIETIEDAKELVGG